ncbi:phosphoribosylaminoimidazolesuccinocarboxamide synthase [Chloroflexota bacterium]
MLVLQTDLPLKLFARGKVRDSYDLGDRLLMVATDRVSAFDVVLPCAIPGKGVVLNKLSAFWFEKTASLIPNHFETGVDDLKVLGPFSMGGDDYHYPDYLIGRSMMVKKAWRVPVECVVRGYLSGSAWAEYRQNGTINSLAMPTGLQESQELPQPLFTPTTKEETGHDQALHGTDLEKLVGQNTARELEERSLEVYEYARKYAMTRGFIIADTKMEFGIVEGRLILIDELLTPDSSRFWDVNLYQVGKPQPSFDKQPLRDWLVQSGWNEKPPAPMLSEEIIELTSQRYEEVYRRLTGQSLERG